MTRMKTKKEILARYSKLAAERCEYNTFDKMDIVMRNHKTSLMAELEWVMGWRERSE